jgi:hypothetical protein
MVRIRMQITGQPMDMLAGPPLFQACPKDVRPPERMQMIEKVMAKLEKLDQLRRRSCR